MEAEFHAGGRKDKHDKANSRFLNFASVPNKLTVSNNTADYSSTVDYPNTVV